MTNEMGKNLDLKSRSFEFCVYVIWVICSLLFSPSLLRKKCSPKTVESGASLQQQDSGMAFVQLFDTVSFQFVLLSDISPHKWYWNDTTIGNLWLVNLETTLEMTGNNNEMTGNDSQYQGMTCHQKTKQNLVP